MPVNQSRIVIKMYVYGSKFTTVIEMSCVEVRILIIIKHKHECTLVKI